MITRAALAVAALLASAPLGSTVVAADWDRSAAAAHHHARAHHGHRMHHGHHMHRGHHAWKPGHRQVLYRNPAYRARWAQPRPAAVGGWHGHHRRHVAYRAAYLGPRYAYPTAVRYSYAQPVAGSYVGGGLIGALFNQPACHCR
jgi:hypothetical protein